ncbi:chitin binding protein [Phlyctema vagabunda]|uniref:Chitin binding protein n=1 Tax=Phlyctema vagabunda TaxID=108571 RepID=A0ABR4PD04_9HELO
MLPSLILVALSLSVTVYSHGGLKLMGALDAVEALKSRASSPFPSNHFSHDDSGSEESVDKRAENMKCGPQEGSCPTGFCCSIGGFCGKGFHYCSGPACQLSYGDSCDGNISPLGEPTADVPRPHLGNVSYGGTGIYFCTKKNVVALTFDDGPYIYTNDLLDILKRYDAKATFFLTGNNMGKGEMDNETTGYPQIVKRMYAEGHQLASHTWTHQNLSGISAVQRENQMYFNEMAFRNILGFFPTYMRPPYSQADNATQQMLSDMGYHVIYYNINSDDYSNDTPELIQNAKDEVNAQFGTVNVEAGYPANFIEIGHDIHDQTVYNLTSWTLERMLALGFGTSVTVGECLGDPPENWYRAASGALENAPVSKSLAAISPTAIPTSGPSASASLTGATAQQTSTSQGSKVDKARMDVVLTGILGFIIISSDAFALDIFA